MNIETIIEQVRQLTDDQFYILISEISNEERRRHNLKAGQEVVKEVITELRTSGTVEAPTDTKVEDIQSGKPAPKAKKWKNPGTLHHKMYLKGDIVYHRNKLWVSTHDGLNHWEPGADGIDERIWAEVPVEEAPTPEAEETTPVKPSTPKWKSGVNYQKGDKVLYKGTIYEIIQPHTSAGHWKPDAVASLYKRV